eukprot:SAG11_NODE_11445_length_758_cov_1.018154_1_plen_72_part_10
MNYEQLCLDVYQNSFHSTYGYRVSTGYCGMNCIHIQLYCTTNFIFDDLLPVARHLPGISHFSGICVSTLKLI